MALTCTDVGKLVHPYLDGEFSDEDRVALERHTAECGACRDLVQYEMAFKASMRAKLSPPKASSSLRRRVLASLDEVDRLHSDSRPRRLLAWLLPTGSMAAAAAAIALFFLYPNASQERKTSSIAPATRSAGQVFVDEHRRAVPLPMQQVAQSSDQIERDLSRLQRDLGRAVGVPVRLPRLGVYPTGAWVIRINRDRKAARVHYRLEQGDISIYTYDSSGMRPTTGHTRRVGDTEVLCDKQKGFTKVFWEKDGVGRMVVSGELDEDQVLRLIRNDLGFR